MARGKQSTKDLGLRPTECRPSSPATATTAAAAGCQRPCCRRPHRPDIHRLPQSREPEPPPRMRVRAGSGRSSRPTIGTPQNIRCDAADLVAESSSASPARSARRGLTPNASAVSSTATRQSSTHRALEACRCCTAVLRPNGSRYVVGSTAPWSNMSAEAEVFAVRMTYGAEAAYKSAGREPTDDVNSKLIVMWGWSPGDDNFPDRDLRVSETGESMASGLFASTRARRGRAPCWRMTCSTTLDLHRRADRHGLGVRYRERRFAGPRDCEHRVLRV